MGKLRKVGKKIWKGIKKVGKKIGKGFKKVFKGVGKFLGKLGPIGTIAMMIAMPYMGAYLWQGFGAWAGGLQGTFGTVMKGVYTAGNSVMGVYKNITQSIYGTLKQIPGVGDALEGFDRFLDRTRSAMGMESGSISVMKDNDLNQWVGTDVGAQSMGYDNAAAFKAANPTYFNAEGTLSKSGLNFTRGKGMAYEAHLRGRDVFKKVDGEFDFNTYSDNFNNNVLGTDVIKGDISKFGEVIGNRESIVFRTGRPIGTQQMQTSMAEYKASLSPEELKTFDAKKYMEGYKYDSTFDAPKGFFDKPIANEVSFEGVGSRYTRQVPMVDADGTVRGYTTQEGTKLGTAAFEGIKKTALQTVGGEQPVKDGGGREGYYAQVADAPVLEAPSTTPLVTAGPATYAGLNYMDLLQGSSTASGAQLSQFLNGGTIMPHLMRPLELS